MNYDSLIDTSIEKRAEFIQWLVERTLTELKAAEGNPQALQEAIKHYYVTAIAANLAVEQVEDVLGVNEPSIMDLANMSEADEEVVIDAFELLADN